MLIRGLDFARHNVIIGSEAETPSAQNPTQQPRGEMVARVLAVTGSEATLQLGGQRVVVESHVPLNTGDKLNVRVYQDGKGGIRLAILPNAPAGDDSLVRTLADADVDTLLQELGLPADDRTRQIARALLARDGSLEKPALKQLLTDLRTVGHVTAREAGAAALLQKAGAPVSAANIEVVAARAEPSAPVQVGPRLAALKAPLEALRRQLPERSPEASLIDEVLDLIGGLPLEEQASPPRVTEALKHWMSKLQPETPKQEDPALPAQGKAGQPAAEGQSAAAGKPQGPAGAVPRDSQGQPLPAKLGTLIPGQADLLDMPTLAEHQAPDSAKDAMAGKAAKVPAEAARPGNATQESDVVARDEMAKPGQERGERVPASQHNSERVGISNKALAPAGNDLASMLDRLGKGLGAEHQKLGNAIREAVAELRYAQLANVPSSQTTGLEFLVPLLVPQLSPDQPEGRIQVYHKPNQKGGPIDPRNVRLVFILETEHLSTLQADMTIKDGVVDLVLGVQDPENRNFLDSHLEELASAINGLGWEMGRFGARLAKGMPPKVRQEEGLMEIVRFDRRV